MYFVETGSYINMQDKNACLFGSIMKRIRASCSPGEKGY
jgi:hypothetical protein